MYNVKNEMTSKHTIYVRYKMSYPTGDIAFEDHKEVEGVVPSEYQAELFEKTPGGDQSLGQFCLPQEDSYIIVYGRFNWRIGTGPLPV